MKILITGGGGFLGFRLAKQLLARGQLGGKPLTSLTLLDGAFPDAAASEPRLKAVVGDVSDPKVIAAVCPPDTDAVFHLAAIRITQCAEDPRLAREVLLGMIDGEGSPEEIVAARGLEVVSDDGALMAAIDEALAADPDVLEKIREGKVQAAGAIIGAVMKAMKGQADAARVRELVIERAAAS